MCGESEKMSSLNRLPMMVVAVGMVGIALQPSLGSNPRRPEETLHPTVPGRGSAEPGVRLNQGLGLPSLFSVGGLLF